MIDTAKRKLDKSLVLSAFQASGNTYEENAVVQNKISLELISLIQKHGSARFDRVLEIGCCTGFLTDQLCKTCHIDELFINDIVPGFCDVTRQRVSENVQHSTCLSGDVEQIELPERLDLIVSSATFQWIEDLDALFEKLSRSLTPNGLFACTIFGVGTMQEVREITGDGLEYHSDDNLFQMVRSHFTPLVFTKEEHKIFLPTVRAVLRHIKQTGVSGVTSRPKWTHTRLKQFESEYKRRFATPEGLPVTYCSTTIIGKKIG